MSDINKAFNLPLRSDGKKLIEATGNVCAVFNLPNEAAAIANFVNTHDELIEQLQQRIAELERERDELAAHVELVKEIFITLNSCHLNSDWNENAGKLRSVIMQTPTHSLAEHDAEVARKAFMAGFQKGKIKRPVVDLRNPIDLANECAQHIKENPNDNT